MASAKDKRRCICCGCILNSHNKTKYCWSCFAKTERKENPLEPLEETIDDGDEIQGNQ